MSNWVPQRSRVVARARQSHLVASHHCRVVLRADLKSIVYRRRLFEVAFVWELTEETIHLPLGCLQGGKQPINAKG